MCGIVGYVGEKNCPPLLIEGLKRLEYRGYDSSGIATLLPDGSLYLKKKSGHVRELAHAVEKDSQDASIGIAHTRWATHGAPTDTNAHPHISHDGTIAVVHNGIIENADALRKKLQSEGIKFVSETDTEVLPNLIARYFDGDLESALKSALSHVDGSYGIAVVSTHEPGTLMVARNGSPIVVGVGEGEMFVASDPAALVAHTKHVVFLDDGEVAKITENGFKTTDLANHHIDKTVDELDMALEEIELGSFPNFMLKEICEQPHAIQRGLQGRANLKVGDAQLGGLNMTPHELRKFDEVCFLACGTSYHAAKAASYVVEDIARIPCRVEIASEFRYRNPIVSDTTLYFAVSQSGETADTLAAMREVQRKGGRVLGLVNTVGSTIARESDGGIYIRAGQEVAVASTKAFTSQFIALVLFAIRLGRMHSLSLQDGRALLEELEDIPEKIEQILKSQHQVERLAESIKMAPYVLFLGRGPNAVTALEGALKLKELAYIQCEGFPAAEMKHGPIALISPGTPVIVLAPHDHLYEKTLANLEEVRARGAMIISITNPGDDRIYSVSDTVIEVPKTKDLLTPLLNVIPLQLLAYFTALKLDRNIDKPRNLAKSVTVE